VPSPVVACFGHHVLVQDQAGGAQVSKQEESLGVETDLQPLCTRSTQRGQDLITQLGGDPDVRPGADLTD
jgi:hypothetical protein